MIMTKRNRLEQIWILKLRRIKREKWSHRQCSGYGWGRVEADGLKGRRKNSPLLSSSFTYFAPDFPLHFASRSHIFLFSLLPTSPFFHILFPSHLSHSLTLVFSSSFILLFPICSFFSLYPFFPSRVHLPPPLSFILHLFFLPCKPLNLNPLLSFPTPFPR